MDEINEIIENVVRTNKNQVLELVFHVDEVLYRECFNEFVEVNHKFNNKEFIVLFENPQLVIRFKNIDYVENWLRRIRGFFI